MSLLIMDFITHSRRVNDEPLPMARHSPPQNGYQVRD